MAHYALLNDQNVVVSVITGRDEDDLEDGVTDWEAYYGAFHGLTCRRTSYNTLRNQHLNGGTPFRGNYAGIGYTYDETRDAFIPPEPANATGFDDQALDWIVPLPEDELEP